MSVLDTNFFTLAGKTAVVTGAAAGIGRAILEVYVAAGAHVIAVDRDGERLKQTCWSSALSERTHPVVADVAREDDVRRAVDAVRAHTSVLHILCNNAGITTRAMLPDLDRVLWDECLATNLTGPYLLTRHMLPLLVAACGASVINMSSIHARLTGTRMSAYAAAKAGLLGLTRALANELGPYGIRVNALCPGYIDTGYLTPLPADMVTRLRDLHPLRRFGQPLDVAGVALFLASDLSGFVSGAVIPIDGGLGVRLPAQTEGEGTARHGPAGQERSANRARRETERGTGERRHDEPGSLRHHRHPGHAV